MSSKLPKKSPTISRTGSATHKETASIATGLGLEPKKKGVVIWPEWNDADINNEKWDVPQKGKDKSAKSPVVQHFFDDPEGKVELPSTLKVDNWKRPQDFIVDKSPVIVDPEGMTNFDLMSNNESVHESELIRWITSQIVALWRQCAVRAPSPEPGAPPPAPDPTAPPTDGEYIYMWRPWEHIYAINKVGKGPNIPAYNPSGKYVVKLFWMGDWRKVIVDDTLPFDENEKLLLPSTSLQHELWPMLLAKAILKVASIDYNGGNTSSEFGDFSVIHCLTGWLPEAIPLQPGHLPQVWDLLRTLLPEFRLPELPPEHPAEGEDAKAEAGQQEEVKDGSQTKTEATKEKLAGEKSEVQVKRGKEDKKDKKEDKKDKKDKDKEKTTFKTVASLSTKFRKHDQEEKTTVLEEPSLPEHPEVVVFASYSGPPKYPVKASALAEMTKDLPLTPRLADASERLRQIGFSHMYPHPVLLTQTRSCPLERPPPPEVVPAWKLIRPKKKKTTPSSEEMDVEPEEEKPIRCLELSSPFINYRVSTVPIPTDTQRPKSALERGSTRISSRPGTANVQVIEETDESISEQHPMQLPTAGESPKPTDLEEQKEAKLEEQKPGAKDGKRRSARGSTRTLKPVDAGETVPHLTSPSPKADKEKKAGANKASPMSKRQSSASAISRDRIESKNSSDIRDAKQGKECKAERNAKMPAGALSPGEPQMTPVETTPLPDGGAEGDVSVEEQQTEDMLEDEGQILTREIWIDFDNFCKCFKSVMVFHKSQTYRYKEKHSETKTSADDHGSVPKSTVVTNKDKRLAQNTANATLEDKSVQYLFVDSLKPTEIVVNFSTLCRWNEPPPPPPKEDSRASVKGRDKGDKTDRDSKMADKTDRDSKMADTAPADLASIVESGSNTEVKPAEPLQPGLLVAEAYSWKSLHIGHPLLRLRTTSVRAAVLSLPEGRHVLRFNMTAPLGYHVYLCSSTPFVFGEEEKVMAELTKESCRFVDNASQVMSTMGKCIHAFHDAELFQVALENFYSSHCPYREDKKASKHHHIKVFNEALYTVLIKVLNEANLATPEMAFAWRVFNFDVTTRNILGLSHGGSSRPNTIQIENTGEPVVSDNVKVLDHWKSREITPDEHVAAIKIQKIWRGYYVRKVKIARTPGTGENLRTQELLQKAWVAIEPNAEQNGLLLFRAMFKQDPDLMPKFPFHKDEWNKISYADYSGTFPEQPPNSWFVVFREIFNVSEDMLCVPKLYVPIPSCQLRVIDNDTGNEMPRVFQKVAPSIYKKNKRGYTFVADANTLDQALPANRWHMRVIGCRSPLPTPFRNEVNSSFHARELRDYYIPNSKNTILRYVVRVTEDHVASIQMTTSKPDVYVKLMVLDNEEEVASSVGKGHVVLPAFIFQKDCTGEDESKRSSSRASAKGNKGHGFGGSQGTSKTKRATSAASQRSGGRLSISSMDDEDSIKVHKYIIQAIVLRNSWPLSEAQWAFVQVLKDLEKSELKVSQKERPPSPAKAEKGATTKVKDKGKAKSKEKDKASRPPSLQFDLTKPNWTLRVVSDGLAAEEIEVKKDTERADEIRAMKKAWEEAEPGRAAKALQSRLQYLSTHTVKVQADHEDQPVKNATSAGDDQAVEAEGSSPQAPATDATESEVTLTLVPPPLPDSKAILQKVDLTPFVRRTCTEPRLRDENEVQRQIEAKQAEIKAYRNRREEVEQWWERDRQQRNSAKLKQLELCEEMQAALDEARESVNAPREAFRQKFLEAERRRLEEIAAQEAALAGEASKNAPSPKGKKGKGSARGKKGKDSARGKKK